MSSDGALSLWKSQLPSYERIITKCINRILTPLTRFPPPFFLEKIQQFKEVLSAQEPSDCNEYTDVIAHHVEGVKNMSIMEIADMMIRQFGGSIGYWQNAILDVGQQISYTNQVSIWHVRKVFQGKLYIDAQNLSNYRMVCKLTKPYVTALINLIKYITKFDTKKDTMAKIDELYRKVKSAQERYYGFCQQIKGLERSLTLDQVSNNLSNRSKNNALKDLFHFKNPSKNQKVEKTSKNTLFNYKFSVNSRYQPERASGPTKNMQQTSKSLQGQNMFNFEQVLKTITAQNQDISSLRNSFVHKSPAHQDQPLPLNYTTIWDKDYYFSYVHFPIQSLEFNNFLAPFEQRANINYEIYSEDQYNDLLGEDVEDEGEESEVSEVSKNSFVVSDDYFSEDQDQEPKNEIKPKKNFGFGERWSFQKGDEKLGKINLNFNINSYAMVLIQPNAKLPLPTREMEEMDAILYNIVDGKDKESIMQAISKEKAKISKPKINQFLKKKCRAITDPNNPSKTIYKIIELQQKHNENENDDQNCLRLAQVQQKQDENQTCLNDHEYFSQPCQRTKKTRQSNRSTNSQLSEKQQQKKYVRHPDNQRQTRSRNGSRNMPLKSD